jgi:hypothetical protein
MASPAGEKATSLPVAVGRVTGFVYFVPKPAFEENEYAEMYGEAACAKAMTPVVGVTLPAAAIIR